MGLVLKRPTRERLCVGGSIQDRVQGHHRRWGVFGRKGTWEVLVQKVLKVGGSIVIFMIVLLVTLRATGFEPRDCANAGASWSCRTPGLWLRGELVTAPVTDWSFTDNIQTVKIQTQTPLLLPYSVAIWCASYNGNLYVTSYRGRRWVEDVIQDPHVRVKIDGRLYDRAVSLVSDPAEKAAVLQAKGKKYPAWKVPPVETATVFRVMPE